MSPCFSSRSHRPSRAHFAHSHTWYKTLLGSDHTESFRERRASLESRPSRVPSGGRHLGAAQSEAAGTPGLCSRPHSCTRQQMLQSTTHQALHELWPACVAFTLGPLPLLTEPRSASAHFAAGSCSLQDSIPVCPDVSIQNYPPSASGSGKLAKTFIQKRPR